MNAKATNPIRQEIIKQLVPIFEPWVYETVSPEIIDEQINPIADLGLDSIGILNVIMEIEKKFNIRIEDNQLDSSLFSKVGNLVSLIQEKKNENN
ncbi:acyl carrier protein [Planctomycetota bacterium]